jgi:hypothetical protein
MDITSTWSRSESSSSKVRVSKKAIFALVFYVIMPIIAISMIMAAYPELSKERLIGMLFRAVPIGIFLIFVSQFSVRYEKGDIRRFILNEIYVVLVVLWLFMLLGGEPIIHQTYGEYHFNLNIWNYIILILLVTCINALFYYAEYRVYRKKSGTVKSRVENNEHNGAMDENETTIAPVQLN